MRTAVAAAALLGMVAALPNDIHDHLEHQPSVYKPNHPGTSHHKSKPPPKGKPQPKPVEPCLQVAQALTNGNTKVNGSLALSCLRSVPLDAQNGTAEIEGIKTIFNFQSTLAYLKDPTPGYLYPATDILGGLDSIKHNLQQGTYTNEFDFQYDIWKLIASAYDGHFEYVPDIVGVFIYGYPLSLYSISTDGTSLPSIYLAPDVDKAKPNPDLSQISPVSTINGVDVEQFLNQFASYNQNQDPDTNYNSLFTIVPLNSQLKATGGGSYTGALSGTRTVLTQAANVTLADGTIQHFDGLALSRKNFTGVVDGPSFFQKFCTNQKPAAVANPPAPTPQDPKPFAPLTQDEYTTMAAPEFYPTPFIMASDYSIGGYFPDSDNTLAVLSVPTFEPADTTEFQNIVRQFLATAQDQGKTKLVIDLRGNPGGDVLLGYDMFEQLFPTKTPYGGTNFRAHPMFHDTGAIVSAYYKNADYNKPSDANLNTYTFESIFNYNVDLQQDGSNYDSWEQAYGPNTYHNDKFTNIIRWNLSNTYETGGLSVSNYADLTGYNTVTVFDPANIVLVQDGNCASTCTVFSEMMKAQGGGVRQVAFGGRKQTGPMQGVGAVKGANVYPLTYIAGAVAEAFDSDTTAAQQKTIAAKYPNWENNVVQAIKRAARSGANGRHASVNVRNQIRENDNTGTPIHFVYEASDCRLFYTPDQLYDMTKVWSAAGNAIWGDGTCVHGSTKHPSSQYVVGQAELNAAPAKSKWNNGFPNLQGVRPTDI